MSTKTITVIQASASNTAGSTTNSSTFSASTDYGSRVVMQITNGATGPTVACNAILQESPDGGTSWYPTRTFYGQITNSGVYVQGWDIGPPVKTYRIQFTGNTGQAVTVYAFVSSLTSL